MFDLRCDWIWPWPSRKIGIWLILSDVNGIGFEEDIDYWWRCDCLIRMLLTKKGMVLTRTIGIWSILIDFNVDVIGTIIGNDIDYWYWLLNANNIDKSIVGLSLIGWHWPCLNLIWLSYFNNIDKESVDLIPITRLQ